MNPLLRLVLILVVLTLGGCAAGPGIPDTVYFRLPPRVAPAPERSEPLLLRPIVVETLLADGLHSDQALIYSLDPDGARLKAYHYQLWVDPPVRMLQRRLIGALRDARVADVVTDSLPNQVEALRIEGRLERFERIRLAENEWKVVAMLSMRADLRDGKPPLLLREYVQEEPAAGPSVRDSVNALGAAMDRIHADFLRDLEAVVERG